MRRMSNIGRKKLGNRAVSSFGRRENSSNGKCSLKKQQEFCGHRNNQEQHQDGIRKEDSVSSDDPETSSRSADHRPIRLLKDDHPKALQEPSNNPTAEVKRNETLPPERFFHTA